MFICTQISRVLELLNPHFKSFFDLQRRCREMTIDIKMSKKGH